jgi:hypothetical protein
MRDIKVAKKNFVDKSSKKRAGKELRISKSRYKSRRNTVQIRIQNKWYLLVKKEAKEEETTLSKHLDQICRSYFIKNNQPKL